MWYYRNGCEGVFEALKCEEFSENTCGSIKEKIKIFKTLLVL